MVDGEDKQQPSWGIAGKDKINKPKPLTHEQAVRNGRKGGLMKKGSQLITGDFKAKAAEIFPEKINGKTVTWGEAIVAKLAVMAAKGNVRAIDIWLDRVMGRVPQSIQGEIQTYLRSVELIGIDPGGIVRPENKDPSQNT